MTESERADFAKELLNSAVFKAAYADLRATLIEALENSEPSDKDSQHEFTLMLKCLRMLQGQLERYVQDAEVEKRKQEQQNWIEKARQRLPGFRR